LLLWVWSIAGGAVLFALGWLIRREKQLNKVPIEFLAERIPEGETRRLGLRLKTGEELCLYRTPPVIRHRLDGRSGLAHVGQGKIAGPNGFSELISPVSRGEPARHKG
jgi:hypothetical protein